jgi:hypothetical protein
LMTRGEGNVRKFRFRAAAVLVVAVAFCGCSAKGSKVEAVATVNGDTISVKELREFLGAPGGKMAFSGISVDKKKEALDRLVAGRLLEIEARAQGLDNTPEYRAVLARNEQSVLLNALLRKELEEKVKVDEKELAAETAKVKEANKGIADNEALSMAGRSISERQLRKIEEDLVAAARKEMKPAVDQAMLERVVKGEAVGDNAVLATSGNDKLLLGDVKKILQAVAGGGQHAQQDLTRNPEAMNSVVNREITGRALNAYAKSRKIEGTEACKATRRDMERSVLISLSAEKAVPKDLQVTDPEIDAAYKEHAEMFAREGKKIPLAQVKEQLRGFLMNDKRRKALDSHVAELKKKAKITVDEGVLPRV